MKKTLVGLFAVITLAVQGVYAACPCQNTSPCDDPCPKASPCDNPCPKEDPCEANRAENCEGWLTQTSIDEYSIRMNLNNAQKCEAMQAVENFKNKTRDIASSTGNCGSKCDCKRYMQALKELDCDMKKIITSCQKSDYNAVRKEVKNQVKCCHKCFTNPFSRCASCDECDD